MGFLISLIFIAYMLWTALLMSDRAIDADLNWIETIGFQWGTSLYAGWLSAATILNASIWLKESGIAEGWDETAWTIGILWVAVAIYGVNSYLNEDPLFSAVLIWASFGIQARNEDEAVDETLALIIQIMSAYVSGLFVWKLLDL